MMNLERIWVFSSNTWLTIFECCHPWQVITDSALNGLRASFKTEYVGIWKRVVCKLRCLVSPRVMDSSFYPLRIWTVLKFNYDEIRIAYTNVGWKWKQSNILNRVNQRYRAINEVLLFAWSIFFSTISFSFSCLWSLRRAILRAGRMRELNQFWPIGLCEAHMSYKVWELVGSHKPSACEEFSFEIVRFCMIHIMNPGTNECVGAGMGGATMEGAPARLREQIFGVIV